MKTRADALLEDSDVRVQSPGEPGRATRTQRYAARFDDATRQAQSRILDKAWATPIQLARDSHSGLDDAEIQAAAAHGVASGGGPLPHLDAIQRSFGAHDVTSVTAHVGGAAKEASRAMGAHAYATGNHVAFAEAPDLFLAAHEAAHVVQQRAGVHLSSAVGQAGDAYEQHADAVAARVVAGESAADLLDGFTGGTGAGGVQRRAEHDFKFGEAPAEAHALGVIRVAINHAENELRRVGDGRVTADEACARLVKYAADAKLALITARTWQETHRQYLPNLRGDDAYETIKSEVYRLFANLMRLMQAASGPARGSGAAALQGVAVEIRAEAALAKIPMDGSIADLARKGETAACPPGAAEDGKEGCSIINEGTRRGVLEAKAMVFLVRLETAFVEECNEQKDAIEAEIASDRALAGALIGLLVGPIVSAAARAVSGHAARLFKPGDSAKPNLDIRSHSELTDAQKDLAGKISGELNAAGRFVVSRIAARPTADGREGTLGAIEVLKVGAQRAVSVTLTTLRELDDDQLQLMLTELEYTDPEVVRRHVADHVARYREQVEPIGERDLHRDSRDSEHSRLRGRLAQFRPAWIQLGEKQRLARVSHVRASTLAELGGAVAAQITGDEVRLDRYHFECWIDDEFQEAALGAWSRSWSDVFARKDSALRLTPDDFHGLDRARVLGGLGAK